MKKESLKVCHCRGYIRVSTSNPAFNKDFSSKQPGSVLRAATAGKTKSKIALPCGLTLAALKGFTLIELLVIVLIIGILVAIALPQYEKAAGRARSAEALANLKTLAQAAEVAAMETGAWPKTFDMLSVELPGEAGTYKVPGDKRLGKYNSYVLTNGRVDAASNDKLRQPSFLYVSDWAPVNHHPVPGKRYYCYYNPKNDGKDETRKNLCKIAGGKEFHAVTLTSIWAPLD